MKWYRLVPVVLMGAFLLGGVLVQPASAGPQDNIPGSMLVYPYFDCTSGWDTKIRLTNGGVVGVQVRFTLLCEPSSQSASAVCDIHDRSFFLTAHETRGFDVCTQLNFGAGIAGVCPTGRGAVVAFAETQCTNPAGCASVRGGTIESGEWAPISWNSLIGDQEIFTFAPNPIGPQPDVEAVKAIAIQSPQNALNFLGFDTLPGQSTLNLTFCDTILPGPPPTPACDYVGLPRQLATDFAAAGGVLAPAGFPPAPAVTEIQTNFILFTLDLIGEFTNPATHVSINLWNEFETNFSLSNQFFCWVKFDSIVSPLGSPIFNAANLGSNYGNVRFTSTPVGGVSPTLLGAVEEVSSVGRTLRTMFHIGSLATTLVLDVEGP